MKIYGRHQVRKTFNGVSAEQIPTQLDKLTSNYPMKIYSETSFKYINALKCGEINKEE
jgi:hypothetical protein